MAKCQILNKNAISVLKKKSYKYDKYSTPRLAVKNKYFQGTQYSYISESK